MHCSFDIKKIRYDFYKREDSLKMFFEDCKEHGTEITKCEKLEMLPLADDENTSFINCTIWYIFKREFDDDVKNYCMVRDHCLYT